MDAKINFVQAINCYFSCSILTGHEKGVSKPDVRIIFPQYHSLKKNMNKKRLGFDLICQYFLVHAKTKYTSKM
jgi:hypothetical protein